MAYTLSCPRNRRAPRGSRVRRRLAGRARLRRSRVDLDLAYMAAIGKTRHVRGEGAGALQADAEPASTRCRPGAISPLWYGSHADVTLRRCAKWVMADSGV